MGQFEFLCSHPKLQNISYLKTFPARAVRSTELLRAGREAVMIIQPELFSLKEGNWWTGEGLPAAAWCWQQLQYCEVLTVLTLSSIHVQFTWGFVVQNCELELMPDLNNLKDQDSRDSDPTLSLFRVPFVCLFGHIGLVAASQPQWSLCCVGWVAASHSKNGQRVGDML